MIPATKGLPVYSKKQQRDRDVEGEVMQMIVTISRPRCAAALLLFLAMSALWVYARSPAAIEVGSFSSESPGESIPTHWEPLHFRNIHRHTQYELVNKDGTVAIQASADGSASGLIREIQIDPENYPVIQWHWKVMNVLEKENTSSKQGDDYPARIYIAFQRDPDRMGFWENAKHRIIKLFYGRYPPQAALNYIWASSAPKGLTLPNPYTDRAMMIVVESGKAKVGRWITEERNIVEDYKEAFGESPPMVAGVAIMTDTDNTGGSATAYYGDILFKRRKEKTYAPRGETATSLLRSF
jgi:hypothetical protein